MLLALLVRLAAAADAPAAPDVPVAPDRDIQLCNGKDLAGFHTWLKATGREDPKKVFTVSGGMIHISGVGLGYLATNQAYKDYDLTLEYKWGKYHESGPSVRNSGLLVHAIGPDGGAAGTFMTCLECQIAQGCEGDLIVIRGKDDVASPLDQWTKIECICRGDRVTIIINGVTVNECFHTFPAAGKILLEEEGSEIFFRNVVLHPLKKTP
jgi:hypothetical protein